MAETAEETAEKAEEAAEKVKSKLEISFATRLEERRCWMSVEVYRCWMKVSFNALQTPPLLYILAQASLFVRLHAKDQLVFLIGNLESVSRHVVLLQTGLALRTGFHHVQDLVSLDL